MILLKLLYCWLSFTCSLLSAVQYIRSRCVHKNNVKLCILTQPCSLGILHMAYGMKNSILFVSWNVTVYIKEERKDLKGLWLRRLYKQTKTGHYLFIKRKPFPWFCTRSLRKNFPIQTRKNCATISKRNFWEFGSKALGVNCEVKLYTGKVFPCKWRNI